MNEAVHVSVNENHTPGVVVRVPDFGIARGEDGLSAYEQAVMGGYTGSEAQFNEELSSFKTLHDETVTNATAAAGSAENAASSASSSATSAAAASASAGSAAGSASSAASSAATAAASAASAGNSASTAEQKASEAASSATAASTSATSAQGSASNAASSATAASASATAAGNAQTAAETAASHYPQVTNGYWYVWDVSTGAYVNTNVKAVGEDGLPGRDGRDGVDGQDGAPGQDGADGYSPTATVTKSGSTATISITDKNGTTTATVSDGQDGAPGQDGQDGQDGAPGPNQVTTNTATNITGLLKGDGSTVSAATPGTDYATPQQVNAKYTKPASGIPKSDLAQDVQTSLGKADTALQIVPNTYRTAAEQDMIDAGKLDAPATGSVGQILEKGSSGPVWADRNPVVSVTGTTPTITAQPGVRYVCGEVSTLDIALPASGVVDVTFVSGSTPTVLTITPPSGVTLKWANGFDSTALDADTTYEINIMDGLGVAVEWT